MSYRSSVQYSGGDADSPDYVYYNADIINNTTDDQAAGVPISDPPIRFNETRDTAIVKDSSEYLFSIVRFTMDGANRDLPLFIPQIQESTGQTNVNLTQYSMAFGCEGVFSTGGVSVPFAALPPPRFVQYIPETKNTQIAPRPRSLQNNNFLGDWSASTQYKYGDIVAYLTGNIPATEFYLAYNSFQPPFYTPITPPTWSSSRSYSVGDAVLSNGVFWVCLVANGPTLVPPGTIVGNWSAGVPLASNPTTSPYWMVAPSNIGNPQDIGNRYYWCYTYEAWLNNVNLTIYSPLDGAIAADGINQTTGLAQAFTCCWGDLYALIYNNILIQDPAAAVVFLAIYPDLATFAGFTSTTNVFYVPFPPPTFQFDPNTNRFKILASSSIMGNRTNLAAYPSIPGTGLEQTAVVRMFMNSNMFGLFSNFSNLYWNTTSNAGGPYPGVSAPVGYVNEILFPNKLFQNLITLTSPNSPIEWTIWPWWVNEQEWNSNDALWSPISSLVFTSTLLPVKTESTGAPVVLGQGNLGFSSATVQSAFQPIITDIALDTSVAGSQSYRRFTIYIPQAEYRLSDFTRSKQEIRNIDIQVFWKSRLSNQLFPIYMFNLSSVSLKIMFKHKRTSGK